MNNLEYGRHPQFINDAFLFIKIVLENYVY
jgi:hypothetical protein